jgi:colanic acid/amylovoran biosynthesis glycosyltransferase
MKLLVVSSRWPFSNKEAFLRPELSELARHFDAITVAPVHSPSGERQETPDGIDVLEWPLVSTALFVRAMRAVAARPVTVARTLFALARPAQRGAAKNACAALKGVALGQWAIEHQVDHIHAYWMSVPATVAMIAAGVAKISWSATAHRWDIYEQNAFDQKARSVSFVRTISARGSEDLRKLSPHLSERIVQVPIGTTVPERPVPVTSNREAFHVVCPASLVEVKGHEDLIEALALLRARGVPITCTFAGDGPLRAALAEKISNLALGSAVEFAGFVPQAQLLEWYCRGRVSAVVLASRENGHVMEGIPSALVEAMAYGIPVVATRSGSVGELVDERCGHIVPPQDPKALAEALFDVFQNDFEAHARAAAAYARVAAVHDVRRQMKQLSDKITTGIG